MNSTILILVILGAGFNTMYYKVSTDFGLLRCIGIGVLAVPALFLNMIHKALGWVAYLMEILAWLLMGISVREMMVEMLRKASGDTLEKIDTAVEHLEELIETEDDFEELLKKLKERLTKKGED